MRFRLWALLLAAAPFLPAAGASRRYIVELEAEPVAEYVARTPGRPRMDSPSAAAHRDRLRAGQNQVRARLAGRQARFLDAVDTVANAVFVEAPEEEAAGLAALPGVRRVTPVRTFRRVLDRALLLHNVERARSQAGGARGGEGVKIAIIDSGIDAGHPGLQEPSLAAPPSFPRTNAASDLAYTSGKVIVARSYVSLLPRPDPDPSARDRVGHGTALAMAAAGVRTAAPLATLSGVAPRAWLGNYKVFGSPGVNDTTTSDVIMKALDDAVADGMDVVNLSLGDDLAPRLEDDPEVHAVERAVKAGVIVVAAAGNNGSELNTMSSPATAPSAIAVGASTNDRTFATSVEAPGLGFFRSVTGNGALPATPVTAVLADVAALDSAGLACGELAANSLKDRAALILRGSCTFEVKLTNAQRAGAVAAIVYAAADSPQPIAMAVGGATIPAQMIGHEAGSALKRLLAAQSSLAVTLRFTREAMPVEANRLASFSAAGPNVDAGIKPDLVAAGEDIYTATQTLDRAGDMYDASGYILVDGTSFSSPIVAGAAALLKSARPGLTADQYRSLLVNTSAAAYDANGNAAAVQQTGAGVLDVDAAVRASLAAAPVTLSFGAGGNTVSSTRTVTLANLGGEAETLTIEVVPSRGSVAPSVPGTVEIAAGGSANVPVSWEARDLSPGAHEGFLIVTGTASGTRLRVPYWYAAAGEPAHITVLSKVTGARRGAVQRDAVLFRVTDAAGVALAGGNVEASVVSGGGAIRRVLSYDSEVPGLYGLEVQMGLAAGNNVFRLQAGGVSLEVTIPGT